jgi:hypothetical protein
MTGGRKYRVRNGLSHDSRYGGVLDFSAITVKSALQMWTPDCRAATAINPKPARDDTGVILIAPVMVALAAPPICATRDRGTGAIACLGPMPVPWTTVRPRH